MKRFVKIIFPVLTLTAFLIGGFYLFPTSPVISASNDFIDPNGDGTIGTDWNSTGASHYTEIDDIIRQPAVPGTADNISITVNSGDTAFFRMSTIAGAVVVTDIIVWIYHNDGSRPNALVHVQLFDDNQTTTRSSELSFDQTSPNSDEWHSVTFSGLSLTQTQLGALSVRLRVSKDGGGQANIGTIYAMYADVTFSQPPTVITNTESAVTDSSATLNGEANPNNDTTTGWFRYSLTSPGTCNTTFGTRTNAPDADLGSGSTNAPYSKPISDLDPNRTYYYCAVADNVAGTATSSGAPQQFTTSTIPPIVFTDPEGTVTDSTAVLNGRVNPNNDSTNAWFRYHTAAPDGNVCSDTWPGSTATSSVVRTGGSIVSYFQTASGLAPSTTYYYCAIANNSVGTAVESPPTPEQFTTSAIPPTVNTLGPPLSVTDSEATLRGEANPNNTSTTGWFRYDTVDPITCNTTFGAATAAPEDLGAGSAMFPYSKTISGLAPNKLHYYCAVASNVAGPATSSGAPEQFTTSAIPPGVLTDPVGSFTNISATLQGQTDPNNASTNGWFRYHTVAPPSNVCTDDGGAWSGSSTTTSTFVSSGDGFVAYSDGVSGLLANTPYYYCAVASNLAGTTVSAGASRQFTTLAGPDLVVPPLTAANISGTLIGGFSLTFDGDVLNQGDYDAAPTTARFRIDVDPIDGVWINLGTTPTGFLIPLASENVDSSLFPWVAVPGTHSFELCANYDYSGEPLESNEGNNCSTSTSFTVVAQALSVMPLTVTPATGENPLPVTLQANITYTGPPAETINYSFWWHCTDPTTSVADASQPPPSGCGALAAPTPGSCLANANGYKCEAVSDESQSTSVHTYNSGSYTPKVIVERGATPSVQDQASVVVDVEADLVAQNLSINFPSPIEGQSLTFRGDIYNAGGSTAAETTARFRLDMNNNGIFDDPGDLILGTPSTISLTPTAPPYDVSSSPVWDAIPGTYRYELCADHLNQEPLESDEGNNCTIATFSVASAQETAGNTSGWSWSSTIGWMSFNCATDTIPGSCAATEYYGVTVDPDTGELSGYAWSENIGWISFNWAETSTPPGPPYNGAETFIAKLDTATNEFSGWGRALSACGTPFVSCTTSSNEGGWDGWIKLHE